MKLIVTLEQLKRVVRDSNEIKLPLTFLSAEDFNKWIEHLERNHPELYHSR